MSDRLPPWARIVLAAIAAVLLPGILKILLRAELSWPLLLALALGKIALSAVSIYARGLVARAFRLLSTLYTVGFAAVVLTGILISPYSAYGIWFETVREGEPRGAVSNLMMLLAAVFSSALAGRLLDSEILLPLYGQALVAAGLLALIYQTRLFHILLLCLLALGSMAVSVRFVRRGNRLRNLVTFLLLFLALLAVSRLPLLFAEPRGSRFVDDRLHPGLRKTVVALFPRFPLIYGIPGFGYGFETDSLGGTPILSEAPIFEIRGRPGQRLYLRTGAYSTYDGRSWSKRIKAEGISSHPANLIADNHMRILALNPGEVPPSSLRISVLAEYYTLLPFTLNTRAIYLPPEQIEGISGNFEEGYRLANPLRSDQSIYLRYEQPGEQRGGQRGAPAEDLPAAERSAYLQLPSRVSPELSELAANLGDSTGDTRGTLRNIERYLARNYTYNLEADRTPAGADFVDTFLFQSKEGYCVHFASAFTVLARLNGIPVRYATGYLATIPNGSFPFDGTREAGLGIVTGLSAHAWPEVWLEDRGWTAWEATTAVNPLYYEEIGEDWLYEYGRGINRLTNRQLRAILGREPASQQRAARGAWSFNWQILFLSIPLLAVLLIAIRAIRRYGILLLAALRPDRSSAVKIVAKIAASFHRRGVDRPDELGWVRWAERISAATPQLAPRLQTRSRRLLTVIQRLMYSDQAFRKRDLGLIRTFYLNYCAGSVISR
jgi:transglutaminase-like putative cysteine protease